MSMTRLSVAAVLIWCGFVGSFFITFSETFLPSQAPSDAVTGATPLFLTYVLASIAFLAFRVFSRKEVNPVFSHLQALAASIPSTFFLVVAIFIVYTIAKLGRLPLPHQPGPDAIGVSLSFLLFSWAAMVGVFLIGYLVVYHFGKVQWRNSPRRISAILIFACLWIGLFVFMKGDPVGFFDWIGD